MVGIITLASGGGAGAEEANIDIHGLGAPIQKQYVGLAN